MPLLHVSTDTITPLYAHSALSEPRLVPTPLLLFALHNRYHDKDRLDPRLTRLLDSTPFSDELYGLAENPNDPGPRSPRGRLHRRGEVLFRLPTLIHQQ